MTGNQTKLDDFVSPSTEENSVVETVELVNGQVLTFRERTTIEDEDFGKIEIDFHPDIVQNTLSEMAREDSLSNNPIGGWRVAKTNNYFTTLSEIMQEARCEEYNVNELEMGLNLSTLEGVSGRDLHTNTGSWAYVSGNVKNWIQNLGGIDAFREAGNRLRNAPKKGQFSISSMSADDKIKSSGITPAEEDFRKENGGWF